MTASQISILMIFPDSDRKDTEKKMQRERQMTCCQEATGSELGFLFFWLETFMEFQKEPGGQDIPIYKSVPATDSGPRGASRDRSVVGLAVPWDTTVIEKYQILIDSCLG